MDVKNGVTIHGGSPNHYGGPHKDFENIYFILRLPIINRLQTQNEEIWAILKIKVCKCANDH